jgi:hypothetical protein
MPVGAPIEAYCHFSRSPTTAWREKAAHHDTGVTEEPKTENDKGQEVKADGYARFLTDLRFLRLSSFWMSSGKMSPSLPSKRDRTWISPEKAGFSWAKFWTIFCVLLIDLSTGFMVCRDRTGNANENGHLADLARGKRNIAHIDIEKPMSDLTEHGAIGLLAVAFWNFSLDETCLGFGS